MRPRLILALLAVAGGLLVPAAAQASSSQTTYFEAPRDLLGDQASRAAAFTKLDSLGVKAIRVTMFWADVAPQSTSQTKPDFDTTDPANYNWSRYDTAIRAAKERGWKVLLTVSGPVPVWATESPRRNSQATRPDPSEFAQFVTAVGREYGDLVDVYSVWNEPNLPRFLGPQFVKGKPVSPGIYRELYKGFLKGIASAGHSDTPVLLGEFEPRGTGQAVAPLTFLRGVLGLDSKYRRIKGSGSSKLRVDGIATHPYTTSKGPFFVPSGPNDVTIGVISRMVRAMDRGAKAGVLNKGLPLYLTEFGIESTPDPIRGVSLQLQAEYRSIAERFAYDNPRVAGFSQYLLRDDDKRPGPAISAYSGFQTGLERDSGTVKPSFDGFRLPLVVTPARSGRRASLWGLVRPATGATAVQVQQRTGSSGVWSVVAPVTTNAAGYWRLDVGYASGRQYRVQWAAPDGSVLDGAPTRAVKQP